jgi:hypothetical protein
MHKDRQVDFVFLEQLLNEQAITSTVAANGSKPGYVLAGCPVPNPLREPNFSEKNGHARQRARYVPIVEQRQDSPAAQGNDVGKHLGVSGASPKHELR